MNIAIFVTSSALALILALALARERRIRRALQRRTQFYVVNCKKSV